MELARRIEAVERRLRYYQVLIVTLLVCLIVSVISLSPAAQAQNQVGQRVRSLVIEDEAGRDRIVMGAPVVERSGRASPCTGVRINDPQGVERFAACLFNDGRVVMGFDAPVGKGDDRNRERITLVADAEGGAYVRFLNRKTGVPGRLVLGADDKLYLEFIQSVDGMTKVKRIGFDGEQVVDLP